MLARPWFQVSEAALRWDAVCLLELLHLHPGVVRPNYDFGASNILCEPHEVVLTKPTIN